FSSRRRHTRSYGDWSSDVYSSDLVAPACSLWLGAAVIGMTMGAGTTGAVEAASHSSGKKSTKSKQERHACKGQESHKGGCGIDEMGRASCTERVGVAVGAGE